MTSKIQDLLRNYPKTGLHILEIEHNIDSFPDASNKNWRVFFKSWRDYLDDDYGKEFYFLILDSANDWNIVAKMSKRPTTQLNNIRTFLYSATDKNLREWHLSYDLDKTLREKFWRIFLTKRNCASLDHNLTYLFDFSPTEKNIKFIAHESKINGAFFERPGLDWTQTLDSSKIISLTKIITNLRLNGPSKTIEILPDQEDLIKEVFLKYSSLVMELENQFELIKTTHDKKTFALFVYGKAAIPALVGLNKNGYMKCKCPAALFACRKNKPIKEFVEELPPQKVAQLLYN